MDDSTWQESLFRLRQEVGAEPVAPADWDDTVARARSAQTLATLQRAAIDGALAVDSTMDAMADAWPADYVEAFRRLGLDDKYGVGAEAGLYGLFNHLDEAQIRGLVSSVKGTVLEIRVRDMIMAGELPGTDGLPLDAHLSESLTQTGHDVEVVDSTGQVIDRIQVKAGEWNGIRPRLDEYASQDIPVAVTTEAAEAAARSGHGADVVDTGISGEELVAQTAEIVDNLGMGHAVDELVPEMAVVALVASAGLRLRSGQTPSEVREWMTHELEDLGIANAAGLAVELLTGIILFRPVTALGAKWGLARARTAASTAASLRELQARLAAVFAV